jgi:hypothetical protein
MNPALDDFEREQEELFQRQMAFLAARSPDDRHRYADNLNWDDRLGALYWIVSQPDCDKATAVMTFWKGEPTGYDWQDCDEPMGEDEFAVAPMLKYIVQRFNTNGFPRSEIAYDCRDSHGLNIDENAEQDRQMRLGDIEYLLEQQVNFDDPTVRLHPDLMRLSIPGRTVGGYADRNEYYDLFPE